MKRTQRTGLTLLEMMIALSLVALSMSAAVPMVDQIMVRFQMTRDHYLAASISQARIERARSVPYAELALFVESASQVDDFGNAAGTEGRFRRTTTVVRDSPVAGLTQMTVRTQICICTRWGWRKSMHPLYSARYTCGFGDESESMVFLFTEYKKK